MKGERSLVPGSCVWGRSSSDQIGELSAIARAQLDRKAIGRPLAESARVHEKFLLGYLNAVAQGDGRIKAEIALAAAAIEHDLLCVQASGDNVCEILLRVKVKEQVGTGDVARAIRVV